MLFSYFNAGLALVFTVLSGAAPFLLVMVLLAVAAFGIANDRRWGYWSAIVLSVLYVLGELALVATGASMFGILNLLFAGILVVLLLHPESRSYQRVWFR